jgi:cellulose synthase/poly-beta-1,6-N-acetylglucosamine synthase-like glycosyltransferase
MKSPDISILITASAEPLTIVLALEAIAPQVARLRAEIIIVCPDDATADAASRFPGATVLRDTGQGKPAALNLGLEAARGKIIVMTDGDVRIGPDALSTLLGPFASPEVGAVTGRPISINPRQTMLGYWSHLLTEAGAHLERTRRNERGEFMICSGYLYAIRAGVVSHIPEDALAEDAVVSQIVGEQGYRIRYAPEAKVFVHYPETYQDWLIQKVRSTGGYAQPIIARSRFQMRSFWHEASAGLWPAVTYPRNIRELLWTILLMLARLHLWLLVLWRVRIRRQPLKQLWQPAASTKS